VLGDFQARIEALQRRLVNGGRPATRIPIGIAFVIGGIFGWLPILGFWMIPVGLVILSADIPWLRRHRRRFVVWYVRRRRAGVGPGRS